MQLPIQTTNGEHKRSTQQIEFISKPFVADSYTKGWKESDYVLPPSRLDSIKRTFSSLAPYLANEFPSWKRSLDIAGSLLGIILTAPVMAVIAIIIKLTSRGSIIFKQARIGHLGRPFQMYKFRSMIEGCDDALHVKYIEEFMSGEAEKNDDGAFKLKDDPRVTPIGRFLRKWSLDELPQLFNVLKGDMSLVGPRPDPCYAADNYARWHHRRTMLTKPGITGLWQVEGRCLVDCDEMMRLDIRYGQSVSLLNDLRLIFRTFRVVFNHSGAY